MFTSGRTRYATDSFSKHRASKATSSKSKKSSSFGGKSFSRRPTELDLSSSNQVAGSLPNQRQLNSAIITIEIGTSPPRLFAAHIDILNTSPYFQQALRSNYYNSSSNQLTLSTEIPEVFSCVLEFLYKGDYSPKLCYSTKRDVWSLEDTGDSAPTSSVWIPSSSVSPGGMSPSLTYRHPNNPSAGHGALILRDTAIYCAAERFALPQLKRIALRKQGLQSGIPVATILASARYAYAHTPQTDRHLRAHYLALIIRSRNTFKKSGTMQMEMGMTSPNLGSSGDSGTALWFDLFVAMCNHLDDMEKCVKSPR